MLMLPPVSRVAGDPLTVGCGPTVSWVNLMEDFRNVGVEHQAEVHKQYPYVCSPMVDDVLPASPNWVVG